MGGDGAGSEESGPQEELFGRNMPGWEKATWILIVVYVLIVLLVFWYLGWRLLGFPL